MPKPDKKSLEKLYVDAGGEKGIEKILTDFYDKMSKDILIGFFFAGKDLPSIVRQQTAFLLRAMGVKATYGGKTPVQAHMSLPPILRGHFDRRLVLLRETLKEKNLSTDNIETWVGFEEQFRKAIVEKQ